MTFTFVLVYHKDAMFDGSISFFSFGPASNVPKLTHYGVV